MKPDDFVLVIKRDLKDEYIFYEMFMWKDRNSANSKVYYVGA